MRTKAPIVALHPDGRLLAGASVTVVDRVSGNPATCYATEDGGGVVPQPFVTDWRGRVEVWLDRGAYTATLSYPGLSAWSEDFDSVPANETRHHAGQHAQDGDDALIEPWVTTLPANPVDGMVVNFVVNAAKGIAWRLKYYAGATGYKWFFIGGSSIYEYVEATESFTADNLWRDATTIGPRIYVPLAGDYDAEFLANMYTGVSGANFGVAVTLGASQPAVEASAMTEATASSIVQEPYGRASLLGLALNQEVRVRYFADVGGLNGFTRRRKLFLRPIRVG